MISRRRPGPLAAVMTLALAAVAAVTAVGPIAAQGPPPSTVDPLHRPYDQLLDLNVRDGLVYYRALKSTRGTFDRYVASLDVPTAEYDGWTRPRQIAFWINAYNAFVIDSVLDAYPINGRSSQYPANSLRQVPGVFEKQVRRAAGRRLTLDDIEKSVLAGFGDPRVFLALGRGALGGGRLRSSAFSSDTLKEDLDKVAAECVTRHECASIDASGQVLAVTAVFSWREAEFVKGFGDDPLPAYPGRSPLERAILHVLAPHFLPGERQTLAKNDFAVRFTPFDWQLNDLTGGRSR
jgi:hypothetical protein